MGQLNGKVAVVTGGSTGIGLATAQRFAVEGAHVYLTGRRQGELDAAVAKVGHDAVGLQGDVARPEDLDRLYAKVKADGNRIDVLVANVAFAEFASLEEATDEHFDKTFGTNVKGTFNTVQKALPLLKNGGSIVLLTSMVSTKGGEGMGTYSASKAAIRSFARTWANELKGRGIRVNALAPGATDTPAVDRALEGTGLDEAGRTAWKDEQVKTTPIARWARAEEQASAALFLASAESSYVTGIELVVDGGLTQV